MSDTDRNNLIAAKLRELADLFHGVAQGAGPATTTEEKPAAKRGRPAKQPEAEPEAPPAEDDKTVTADHPKRAELKAIAKQYATKTSVPEAQKAMKLYGESSAVVPDADLAGAIKHFKNLLDKLAKTAAPADDDSI